MNHKREAEALQVIDLSRAQTLAEGLASTNRSVSSHSRGFKPAELAKTLGATLLFYWLGQNRSYLWVITPAKLSSSLQEAEIDPAVKAYRQEIVGGRDVLASNNTGGRQLHAMLVATARHLIPANSREVLPPAENLYGLNFETLIVPGPQAHFWIEDVTLCTASSLALLASASQKELRKERACCWQSRANELGFSSSCAGSGRNAENLWPLSANKTRGAGRTRSNSGDLSGQQPRTVFLLALCRPRDGEPNASPGISGHSHKLYAREIVKHPLSAQLRATGRYARLRWGGTCRTSRGFLACGRPQCDRFPLGGQRRFLDASTDGQIVRRIGPRRGSCDGSPQRDYPCLKQTPKPFLGSHFIARLFNFTLDRRSPPAA